MYLRDVTVDIWLNALFDAEREHDLDKLMVWWNRWMQTYPQFRPSRRAGRLEKRRTETRRRNYKSIGDELKYRFR